MVRRILLCFLLFAYTIGCPDNPVPPCTCRMIGYHACIITCVGVDNEIDLEKSLYSMKAAKVPIRVVEIFEATLNYLPSKVFKGLKIPKLYIAGSQMVSLSDSEIAFVGLEDCLEILLVQDCSIFGGWSWSQLKDLKALKELTALNAGPVEVNEDIKEIAHLNITDLFFTQDSISYIYDTAFATFKNLDTLSLKANLIKELKRSMFPDPASHLEQIILGNNEIEHLPDDLFTDMPKLVSIILSYNKILTVERTTFLPVWNQLTRINLSHNPLRCDCRLSWLLKVSFPRTTWASCEEPLLLRGTAIQDLTPNQLWC